MPHNLTGNQAFKTIGILGGGQLGKMMIEASHKCLPTYRFVVLDKDEDACAFGVADEVIVASIDNREALETLCRKSEILTFEFENIPVDILADITQDMYMLHIRPSLSLLRIAKDRYEEKKQIQALGFQTADFSLVESLSDLKNALAHLQAPAILKTRVGGYDGKNQWTLDTHQDPMYIPSLTQGGFILEQKVAFTKEVSCIGFRNEKGEYSYLPLCENIHQNGILHLSIAPARIARNIADQIVSITKSLMTKLNVCGTLAIEFFITNEGQIIVNEVAPRPHNSGHYSIDACSHSQFEMHLRAITNQSLSLPILHTPTVMLNILGQHLPLPKEIPSNALVHLYGKKEAKKDRKMGHINFCGQEIELLIQQAQTFYASNKSL